jgi:hypothetical protein
VEPFRDERDLERAFAVLGGEFAPPLTGRRFDVLRFAIVVTRDGLTLHTLADDNAANVRTASIHLSPMS